MPTLSEPRRDDSRQGDLGARPITRAERKPRPRRRFGGQAGNRCLASPSEGHRQDRTQRSGLRTDKGSDRDRNGVSGKAQRDQKSDRDRAVTRSGPPHGPRKNPLAARPRASHGPSPRFRAPLGPPGSGCLADRKVGTPTPAPFLSDPRKPITDLFGRRRERRCPRKHRLELIDRRARDTAGAAPESCGSTCRPVRSPRGEWRAPHPGRARSSASRTPPE